MKIEITSVDNGYIISWFFPEKGNNLEYRGSIYLSNKVKIETRVGMLLRRWKSRV